MVSIRDSADFARLLKGLADDVVDAHIHYQLYQDLAKAISKHPLVVQQSNVFWTFTLQAHLNSAVYALFRVYDQDGRALHLRSLLTTIQENLHLFDEEAFRQRLSDNPYVANLAQDSRINLTRFSRHFHLALGKEVSDGKTDTTEADIAVQR